MNRFTKEDILHVSDLAKLYINENEIEKYRIELEEILNNINHIESINIEEDIMVSPSKNVNVFYDEKSIENFDVMLNVKDRAGDFIKVEVEND